MVNASEAHKWDQSLGGILVTEQHCRQTTNQRNGCKAGTSTFTFFNQDFRDVIY